MLVRLMAEGIGLKTNHHFVLKTLNGLSVTFTILREGKET
jgi:hypothetical protein